MTTTTVGKSTVRELVDREPLVAEEAEDDEGEHHHRRQHRIADRDAGEPHGSVSAHRGGATGKGAAGTRTADAGRPAAGRTERRTGVPSRTTPVVRPSTCAPSPSPATISTQGSPPIAPRTPRVTGVATARPVVDQHHVGSGLVGAHRGKRQGEGVLAPSSIVPRANRPLAQRRLRLDREVDHDRPGAGLGARG
jgi:hypothetical protein